MQEFWNLAIALLASFLIVVGAIVSLRSLFLAIYATGNQHDALLLEWMQRANILNWKVLGEKTGLDNFAILNLRMGAAKNLKLSELSQVAQVLSIPLAEFLDKLGLPVENPELEASRQECWQLSHRLQQLTAEKETLRQEGLRLHQELQQQRHQLTQEFRETTFEQLQTLLTNYPSIQPLVSIKPELPAKNLLSLLTPLDNLLAAWSYEPIGKAWEQVPYNPQIHQPDASEIAEGELVYIRFVGYKYRDCILCPAKVSRTLPGAR